MYTNLSLTYTLVVIMAKKSSNLNLINKIIKLIESDKINPALTLFRKLLNFEGEFTQDEKDVIYKFGELFEFEKIRPHSKTFISEVDKKIKHLINCHIQNIVYIFFVIFYI